MQSSANGIVDRLFPDQLATLQSLFQVLVDRLGHLKHVQFLTAKDRLQLIVGQDFSFVLWILKFVLLNVRPNPFCDFSSRQWFCANNFARCSEGCIGFIKALFFALGVVFATFALLPRRKHP